MTPDAFLAYLRDQVRAAGSQKAFAQAHGIGQAFLSDVLRGHREPGKTLVAALGFQKVVRYQRIEHA